MRMPTLFLPLCIACLEAQAPPTPIRDLAWLAGKWTSTFDTLVCRPFGKDRMLMADTEKSSGAKEAHHVFAYDPERKALAWWVFSRDGTVFHLVLDPKSTAAELVFVGTKGAPGHEATPGRITLRQTLPDEFTLTVEIQEQGEWKPANTVKYARAGASAQAVADQVLAAMKSGDADAMLACMTPECVKLQADEKAWVGFVRLGHRLDKAELRECKVQDQEATFSFAAAFTMADGTKHGEGLRFKLVRRPEGWLVDALQ